MKLRYWTKDRIAETYHYGAMAKSLELDMDEVRELLWMAERYIDIARPVFESRAHLTVVSSEGGETPKS